MTAAEIVAALAAIAEAIKDAPEVVAAVEALFTAQRTGQPLTPAMKHLEVMAAEKLEGI
jgi:hypothetical protein